MEPQKFQTFTLKLQQSYRNDNFYHTSIHAADVIQNVYYYAICQNEDGNAIEMCQFSTLDLASLFISSGGHDVDHPGHNNLFEQKTRSKLATLYND
jgi:hypothetical protein